MSISRMDRHDAAILRHLQEDASTSNAVIGDTIGLSTSQVSRRRSRLETEGVIRRYRAEVSAAALGYRLDAFVRICLQAHSKDTAADFRGFLDSLSAVRLACAITGDADYLLHVRVSDLQALSELINTELLAHPNVREVRSDVVLDMIKDDIAMPVHAQSL